MTEAFAKAFEGILEAQATLEVRLTHPNGKMIAKAIKIGADAFGSISWREVEFAMMGAEMAAMKAGRGIGSAKQAAEFAKGLAVAETLSRRRHVLAQAVGPIVDAIANEMKHKEIDGYSDWNMPSAGEIR